MISLEASFSLLFYMIPLLQGSLLFFLYLDQGLTTDIFAFIANRCD